MGAGKVTAIRKGKRQYSPIVWTLGKRAIQRWSSSRSLLVLVSPFSDLSPSDQLPSNTYPDGSQMNISSSDLSSELQTPYPTAHLIAPLGPNLWPSFQMWSCSSLLYLHATNVNCLSQKLGNFLSNPWQFLPAPASLFPMSNRLFSPADFTSKVALELSTPFHHHRRPSYCLLSPGLMHYFSTHLPPSHLFTLQPDCFKMQIWSCHLSA